MSQIEVTRPKADDLWHNAAESLSEEERASLDFQRPEKLQILTDLHQLTEKEIQRSEEKRLSFKRKSGEKVIVRVLFAKVAKWITRFKELGDVAVQFDPVHAALPWAGVKFLLEITVSDSEITEAILEHATSLAELIARYAVFEELYLQSTSVAATELRKALTALYNRVLVYLAKAKRMLDQECILRYPRLSSSIYEVATTQLTVDECARLVDREGQLARHAQLKRILDDIDAPLTRLDERLSEIEDNLDESKRTRSDFLAGTGTWLLTHPLYKQWKDDSASSLLWLHGIPGSGKSKLVSLVIEDFLEQSKNGRSPPTAYFYCLRNPAEPGRANPDNILASISRQLARANGVGQLLEPVTRRDDQDLVCHLEKFPNVPLTSENNSDDIHHLVKTETEKLIRRRQLLRFSHNKDEMKEMIVDKISEGADGMFLWATLQLQSLCQLKTDQAIQERIGRLPPKLEDLYREILDRIEESPSQADRKSALNTLHWLLSSRRTLTKKELLAAASTSVRLPTIRLTKDQILDLCCNLVVFDAEINTFTFAHLSVREFLEKQPAFYHRLSHAHLAETCLLSLVSNRAISFQRYYNPTAPESLETIYDYAAAHWGRHCRFAGRALRTGDLGDLLNSFLSPGSHAMSPMFEAWETIVSCMSDSDKDHYFGVESNGKSSAMFTACCFDLTEILERFINDGADLTVWNICERTLLETAMHSGSQDCMDLLMAIDCGLSPEQLLLYAAEHCPAEIVSHFLQLHDVRISDEAILAAFHNSDSGNIVKLLLNQESDISVTEALLLEASQFPVSHLSQRPDGRGVLELFFNVTKGRLPVAEALVTAAAGNWSDGYGIIQFLSKVSNSAVPVTEAVFKAAVRKPQGGLAIIKFLTNDPGCKIHVTEAVLTAVTHNDAQGAAITQILVEVSGREMPFSESLFITAAYKETQGKAIIDILLGACQHPITITQDPFKAACTNRKHARQILETLMEQGHVSLTEDMVLEGIESSRYFQGNLEFLYKNHPENLGLLETTVIATIQSGPDDLRFLLGRHDFSNCAKSLGTPDEFACGDCKLTENLLIVALENVMHDRPLLELLLNHGKPSVTIPDTVLLTAIQVPDEQYVDIVVFLLDHEISVVRITEDAMIRDEFHLTENIVVAAAHNEKHGLEIMKTIISRKADSFHVFGTVLLAAIMNNDQNPDLTTTLLAHGEDYIQITECMILAAARWSRHPQLVELLLH
ncbi:hypothetical protein BDW74DRAFT_181216 [Aspergillus multicolor]|uniref:uncharacterized protein n=1 Tax=Aspergillus multicolor TaxID=41759 RepID=UPI003CCCDB7E